MGRTSRVLAGADVPQKVVRAFPNLSLLSGLYFMGGNAAASLPNLASGATVDLTSNGAPAYADGSVALASITDYYNTGINLSADQTVFCVISKPADTEYIFRHAAFVNLVLRGNGAGSNQIRADGAFGGTCVATFNPGTDFGFVAVSSIGTNTNPVNLYTGAGGTLTLTSNGSMAGTFDSREILLGPSGVSAGGGTHQAAIYGFADSVLSSAQLTDIYAWCREYCARRGITVT